MQMSAFQGLGLLRESFAARFLTTYKKGKKTNNKKPNSENQTSHNCMLVIISPYSCKELCTNSCSGLIDTWMGEVHVGHSK